MSDDDTPLPSLTTSPTMRSRLEEKTAVGSALPWAFHVLLLMTSVLPMVSGVGAMRGGSQEILRPGEALLICPLTEDVNQTKQSVIIGHFPHKGEEVIVFRCDWMNQEKLDSYSSFNFTLEALREDSVVVRVPRTQLKDGSYKCQLVPPDDVQPFTTCVVVRSDDAEDPPTATNAADQPKPRDQAKEETTGLPVCIGVAAAIPLLILMCQFVLYLKGRYSGNEERDDVKLECEVVTTTLAGSVPDFNDDGSCTGVSPRVKNGTASETQPGSPMLGQDKNHATMPLIPEDTSGNVEKHGVTSECKGTASETHAGSPLMLKDENQSTVVHHHVELEQRTPPVDTSGNVKRHDVTTSV